MRSARFAMAFPSQALPCSGSTGFSQLFTAPRGRHKDTKEIVIKLVTLYAYFRLSYKCIQNEKNIHCPICILKW